MYSCTYPATLLPKVPANLIIVFVLSYVVIIVYLTALASDLAQRFAEGHRLNSLVFLKGLIICYLSISNTNIIINFYTRQHQTNFSANNALLSFQY